MAAVLMDFFTWRNDPSAFPWREQSAMWQEAMRTLSLLVWVFEVWAPRLGLAQILGGGSPSG